MDSERISSASRTYSRLATSTSAAAFTFAACLLPFQAIATPVGTGNYSLGEPMQAGSFGGGDGTITIEAGDVFNAPKGAFIGAGGPGEGTVTVSGTGSRLDTGGATQGSLLYVGFNAGTGTLAVSDEGVVTANEFSTVGARALLGWGGTATVEVSSGASLVVQDTTTTALAGLYLGNSTAAAGAGNGTMLVDGSGSNVTVTGLAALMAVGSSNTSFSGTATGTGVVNVTGGGTVSIAGGSGANGGGTLSIGWGDNSNGAVLVSGADSSIEITGEVAQLAVANDFGGTLGTSTGIGSLTITDHGKVIVQSDVAGQAIALIGYGLGTGLVTVDDGGELFVDGLIGVSQNNVTFTANELQKGIMIVNDSGVVTATGGVVVGNGTSGATNGILAGTGTVNGDTTIRTGGLLQPGLSPGTINLNGDLTFDGGSLEIQIAGTNPGQYDVVSVSGVVDLTNANVLFSFIDGYLPEMDDTINFILAGMITNLDLAHFAYEGAGPGFEFGIQRGETGLRFVAFNDATSVPEPSTLGLLGAGLVGLAFARRRRAA